MLDEKPDKLSSGVIFSIRAFPVSRILGKACVDRETCSPAKNSRNRRVVVNWRVGKGISNFPDSVVSC